MTVKLCSDTLCICVCTLETGYKKAGYKNKSLIRLFFPRPNSCNLSTKWTAYKNKSHIRQFFSGTKGILTSGFQCTVICGYSDTFLTGLNCSRT